ncbi:MAG: solute carrier family 23 protein [Eubacteriales bacterium]|nr:solute carrier family 23 protein [Eubacteriales bacterium]
MEEKSNLLIGIREKPGLGRGIVLSFQHVFAMFGATVLVPLLTGLPVNTALLASGIGTLIYILCTGARVPVYLGSSFAYITAITAALGLASTDPNFADEANFAAAATGLMCIGVVYVVVALIIRIAGKEWLKRLLPPIVVGPMIMVIGLGLAPTAISMAGLAPAEGSMSAQAIAVALIALLATALIAVHARGFFKIVPIISGIGIGYIAAIVIDLIFNRGGDTLVLANLSAIGQDIAAGNIFEAPKIMLPFGNNANAKPPFVFYGLDFSAALAMLPLAFVTIAEHIGDHTVLGKICDRDFLQEPGLDRTILGDGLATFVAGMIGGPANTTYGENTAVVGLTRVGSVYVTGGAAVVALLLAFIKPVKDLIGSIPTAVMGGISIILFGFIAANGLRVVSEANVDFAKTRNVIICAVMLVLGLGGAAFQITALTTISGMALAAVAGIILNLILPEEKAPAIDQIKK